jgi:D-alanyl-D-alanine endopeptidase (penicillin-binding protein 7)
MFKIVKYYKYFVITSLLISSLFFSNNPALAQVVSTPYDHLGLSSAVVNAKTGALISGQNYNTILPLASLTKLMTAVVLVKRNINLNKKIIMTEGEINYVNPYIAAGDITSQINLQVGDKVLANNLWQAMLIASSNEAAITLVDNSGLSRSQFVAAMNKQAKAWGLKKTHFTEPTGIDPNNLSTAKEMAVIAQKAYAYLTIRSVSAKPSYSFRELLSGRKISVISRNNSLLAMKPLGMKVGYLTESKINVAVRLRRGAKDRVIVIMHAINNARRNQEISRLMRK